ncbi:uncharacterized protein LOC127255921 [Andrographis paniculata]|uniref:uncharacterized protein LOC127255921 n=1 Tax=Andrographis paniculata TaxID=175694 RepID=UPI0021E6E2EF|nr:uncharacterized protein LOC127255921 [Andrographis paniculata]XP_051137658.1 uncharacterized protein LOC127255921 [Andrographis paniculata]XP_051137659.1 uncharacterized protein LOC127255921 [Andrographis paniculata]XP_051137660.1 uncharacterized protein LOC127255921 [Andrographis paniculata]XP_051137662.1 uncharacterized protein LOC127255921 [Andrographis paniculata]
MQQQSNCIIEASRACFNTCCVNLPHEDEIKPGKVAVVVDPRRGFASAIISSLQRTTDFTNPESLPSLQDVLSGLNAAFPCYSRTVLADDIRAREYHLSNHVCLDYVGNGLFSHSQVQSSILSAEMGSTTSSAFSNAPFFNISCNSMNLNSYLNHKVDESDFQASLRARITEYMNLFEEEYAVVFTANQASAFKLIADSYPFNSNQSLLTVYDYENEAVQAMVDSATNQGARAQSAAFIWPNFRIDSRKLRKQIASKSNTRNRGRGLFVFPLQSRMTGVRYSYQWMNLARGHGWHVLLDTCALGAKDMETLGLSLFQPDFLIGSFFKVFGLNPSGFCCLFIRKSRVSDLTQLSTTMGIISLIPAVNEAPQCREFKINQQKDPSSSKTTEVNTEHETLIEENPQFRGLDHADQLGLILISSRVRCLVNWLVNAFLSLRHPHSGSGPSLIRIYGPRIKLDRGPAIAFNVYDWEGERVDPNLVQKLADRNNISLSCGFLKNICFPKNSEQEKETLLEMRNREEKRKTKQDWGLWVASISIGMLSNFEDVYRVWGFVSRFLDADFVEKERWRYTALNQTTVEI